MNVKFLTLICLIFFSITEASDSLAKKPIFTEEFNIESVACDGLELDGVTYSFTVDGEPDPNCIAGSDCPTTNNILPPCIQYGTPGVLHLRFDRPTTVFGFGIAQLSFQTNIQSVSVDLFQPGAGMLREEVFLDTSIDPTFSGTRYDYQGPAVRTVSIRISDEFSFPIAIDNITYAHRERDDKVKVGKISCPISDIISSYEWSDVPNVEDSATFCGSEADNDDASFGVDILGNGLSYLAFESMDDAEWTISANILDQEARACSVLVNCKSYGEELP